MSFSITQRYNCIVIEFNGDVVGGPDAISLNEKLHELIDENWKNVVIDLKRVKLMNSSGLGMLIGALTTMRNAGGDLRVANASPKIEKLMKMSQLDSVFQKFESTEEAVTSFDQQS